MGFPCMQMCRANLHFVGRDAGYFAAVLPNTHAVGADIVEPLQMLGIFEIMRQQVAVKGFAVVGFLEEAVNGGKIAEDAVPSFGDVFVWHNLFHASFAGSTKRLV